MYLIHPFTVHFPVALLLAHGLFTLLYLRGKGQSFETSAYHCLIAGWFGTLLAVLSGSWDAWRQVYGADVPRDTALLTLVNAHAAVGVALVFVYGRVLLARRRQPALLDTPQQRGGYLRLLVVGVLLVLLDAWLGGQLVYTQGLGVGT